jgi:hypothetical protein
MSFFEDQIEKLKNEGPIQEITPEMENELKKLTKQEEEVARKYMGSYARMRCDVVARKFIECSEPRPISAVWKCRPQFKEWNHCLSQYTTDIYFRHWKIVWILEKNERKKKALL